MDEETGATEVVRYAGVDDVGVVGNPKMVEGQMHGSVAFGLGPGADGSRWSTTSRAIWSLTIWPTYAVPRASDMPQGRA